MMFAQQIGSRRLLCLAAFVALTGGCGGLETPELGSGALTGRILGAAAGAYVYPLGRPDMKVAVAAGGDYSIAGVPAGAQSLVLWDGVDRAELVPVQVVANGNTPVADRFGANASVVEAQRMPLAGSVLAAVAPEGGAIAWLPAYSVQATDLSDKQPLTGGITTVYPLPAGTFTLAAALPGFVTAGGTVAVLSGATATVQVPLPIDMGAAAPGCGSAPGCEGGLVCNPADGRCYMCTAGDASACATGEVCDTGSGLCRASGSGMGAICSACDADADCGPGVCVIATGAVTGYCSHTCLTGTDCPAGFYCGTTSKRCKAPEGCEKWLQTMGATCLTSGRCSDYLANGTCEHLVGQPGYCTAPCKSSTDCRIGSGVASTMSCNGGYCRLP